MKNSKKIKLTSEISYSLEQIAERNLIPEELGGVDDGTLTEIISLWENNNTKGIYTICKNNLLNTYVLFRLIAEEARSEYSASLENVR